jgi:penicillin-binding protein 1C
MNTKKKKLLLYLSISIGIIVSFFFFIPNTKFNYPTSTVLEDNIGDLLGAKIASDGQWRFPPSRQVPEKFKKALLVFEDKNFYNHIGIDFTALGAATYQNIKKGKVIRGGSTLTMQAVRLSRKNPPRTFIEKTYEIILALKLEASSSKKDILELYTSYAPYGGNVVGLEAASWRYFGRSPEKLSWAEAATLAVLPNSPSLIFPGKNQQRLIQKRDRLLRKMQAKGIIDSTTYLLAIAEPVPGPPYPLPMLAPHLLDRAEKEGLKGQKITSTIVRNLQLRSSELVRSHHERLIANGIHNAAVLVAEVETGKVIAYCGNVTQTENLVRSPHVDLIEAQRSSGSILKPLLFAMIVNEGKLLPQALVADIPTIIGGYAPKNYNLTYDGAVALKNAISRSLNVPAVRLLQEYGYEKFHHNLKKLGMSSLKRPANHYGLSLILGGAEAKLWDMANIYRNLAFSLNDYHSSLNKLPIQKRLSYLKEREGKVITKDNVLDAASIFLMFEAMNEVNRPEEEFGWKEYASAYKIAWKTGTSYGHRDGWAIGCTPTHIVAVWVGNADGEGRPKLTGIDAAAPLMFDVFKLLKSPQWFMQPFNDMREMAICRQSGYKASNICQTQDSVWVQKNADDSPMCPYHQEIFLDRTMKYRISGNCESISNIITKSWFILPPVMEYYYKSKNSSYVNLPEYRSDCISNALSGSLDIIYPLKGSKIIIPVELDETFGKTVFEAAHNNPEVILFWYLDASFIGTTRDYHQLAVQPEAGKHTLTVVDEKGETKSINFEILRGMTSQK